MKMVGRTLIVEYIYYWRLETVFNPLSSDLLYWMFCFDFFIIEKLDVKCAACISDYSIF